MFRCWFLAAASVSILSSMVFARPGEVVSKEGQVYRGDVTESDDGKSVLIKSGTIETRLHRLNVAKVEYTRSFDEQFAEKTAKLQPTDAMSRVELGKWANDNGKYAEARTMYEDALKIDPSNREASHLLDVLLKQSELDKKSTKSDAKSEGKSDRKPASKPATTASSNPSTAPTTAEALSPVIEKKTLTPADINVIRQKELRPGENFTARLDNNVQKRFVDSTAMDAVKFNALSINDRARKILDAHDADLCRDVKLSTDPAALKDFRRIQPVILSGCANSGCHATANAGNLALYSPADNEAKAYTNFYLLQTYVKGNQAMIDRMTPGHSLLLEMGLPPEVSTNAHPQVPNFRAAFRDRQDPRYIQVSDWIGKSLNVVQPNYGIEFPVATKP